MPALAQSPSHPQRGRDSGGGRGSQQKQPQASLFSIVIGAEANGGGGQRGLGS